MTGIALQLVTSSLIAALKCVSWAQDLCYAHCTFCFALDCDLKSQAPIILWIPHLWMALKFPSSTWWWLVHAKLHALKSAFQSLTISVIICFICVSLFHVLFLIVLNPAVACLFFFTLPCRVFRRLLSSAGPFKWSRITYKELKDNFKHCKQGQIISLSTAMEGNKLQQAASPTLNVSGKCRGLGFSPFP